MDIFIEWSPVVREILTPDIIWAMIPLFMGAIVVGMAAIIADFTIPATPNLAILMQRKAQLQK